MQMFSKLILNNSRQSRRENGLFFSSMLASVIAFYMILSLSRQDVMIFLTQMESDAVEKLLSMIPVFYSMTLFFLFFLIFYASKYQLERRRHEFGVCLILGMSRIRLFSMLLAEDLSSSIFSLSIGLPAGLLLSELVSLVTARLVGIGIVGHQFSLSWQAVLWTAAGFLLTKSMAFLILSGRISRQEIDALLSDTPEGAKKQMPSFLYGVSLLTGILCLTSAYGTAICGTAWTGLHSMGRTLLLGTLGTFLLFYGLRFPLGFLIKAVKNDRQLHIFNIRQIQETVIRRSGTLALCSLLILAALCCFGAGVGIFRSYEESELHVLDYTFPNSENEKDAETIRQILTAHELDTRFSDLFEIEVGHIRTAGHAEHPFETEPILAALGDLPPSNARDILLNNLGYADYPYLISLDSYNRLLDAAGLPELTADTGEAFVYMDREFVDSERTELMNQILETFPETRLDDTSIRLAGPLQTTDLVTDRSLTLSFALILPEEAFSHYTQGNYEVYVNGILEKDLVEDAGLMSAISDTNQILADTGLSFESYLQNMGRQLFYMVAASYLTVYLAIIFLIIANTVIGVQFLMSQQKAARRYRTLIRLGASCPVLCRSARKQINWYFGLPLAVAACGSLFGVRALFTGLLSSGARNGMSEMIIVSTSMILALCVVEYMYIAAVRRSSDRYLLGLMVPEREE